MKKFLFVLAMFSAVQAKAAGIIDVIETIQGSSATVSGVICTSGTAVQLDVQILANQLLGYDRAWVRLQNQDASNDAFIGFDSAVSTHTGTAAARTRLGERLYSAGGSATYNVGRLTKIWCRAADAAGASGLALSIAQFGYK